MKRRNATIRPAGVLCWSTACLIAGLGLSGCQRSYTATAKDEEMAKTQKNVEELDKLKSTLTGGEVPNNFKLEGVGYYHAGARDFFPEAFGTARDGKYFVNGMWQSATPPVEEIPPSRPTPDALKKVLAALEKEQKEEQTAGGGSSGGSVVHHHHRSGFGVTDALLMYWMLSGNRNSFTPTAGFNSAAAQAPAWQSQIDRDRESVRSYASSNPGYRRAVEESKARGTTVRSGQSVRGGFGGSSSSSSSHSSGGSSSRSSGS
jgi:hypothetical protein